LLSIDVFSALITNESFVRGLTAMRAFLISMTGFSCGFRIIDAINQYDGEVILVWLEII
jgi:hypothetical protein